MTPAACSRRVVKWGRPLPAPSPSSRKTSPQQCLKACDRWSNLRTGSLGGGAEAEGGLQEEASAGRAVQRRRVGEAGDAVLDEVQLLRLNAEAQAREIQGMEQARVLEARVAQLAAEKEHALKNLLLDAAAKDDFSSIVTVLRDTKLSFSTLCELQHAVKVPIARMNYEFERKTAQFITAMQKF